MNEHAETTAALLDDTADLLEADGWCQRAWENPNGERCLVGALSRASVEANLRGVGYLRADSALRDKLEQAGEPPLLTYYNDRPERTQYEVIDLLRHTAKDVRNGAIIPAEYA